MTAFSIDALYEALDAERQNRGITWTQIAREINARYGRGDLRRVNASTLTGLRTRKFGVEGDGVLPQVMRIVCSLGKPRSPSRASRRGERWLLVRVE